LIVQASEYSTADHAGGLSGWRRSRLPGDRFELSVHLGPAPFDKQVSTQFLMSAAIYSAAFLTSQFFQFALGNSPLGTGLRFLPWTATPLFVAPAAGALSDNTAARNLVVPGLLMQGAGFAWIVAFASHSSGYGGYIAPFIIAGTGFSMAVPCVTAAGLNAVSPYCSARRREP